MHKPGETVVTVDAGSAQQWLHLVVGMAPFVGVCLVLGGVIGAILRQRPSSAWAASIIFAVTFYALLIWHSADSDIWSWHYPVASALYQIAPAAIFFVAPALVGAAIVRWFFSRHAKGI